MNDLHKWFQKNDLCPENILYLYRNDRKTVVHRMDGEEVALYAPLHSVWSALPEDMFLNISKQEHKLIDMQVWRNLSEYPNL